MYTGIGLTRMSERIKVNTYSLLWKMVKGKGRKKKKKKKKKERPAGDGYKCVSTREGCGSWGVTLSFCRIKGCGCAVLCCIPMVTHRCYCCNKYRKESIPDPFSCLSLSLPLIWWIKATYPCRQPPQHAFYIYLMISFN